MRLAFVFMLEFFFFKPLIIIEKILLRALVRLYNYLNTKIFLDW